MPTLAELQTEREKLRALAAKEEYEAAYAETCGQAELVAAAASVRQVLARALERMVSRMLSAAGKENEEARVHYLLADAAHEVLTAAGQDAERASAKLPVVGERIKRGAKPRDLLTVSQWADRYRWIKSGTNAPGKWKTALTPYLTEIMDALSEHSPVRTVTFIKSSGVGGTEAMYNWLGYVMHHLQNKDLLVVVPTLELRDRSFNPRLTKMLEETDVLADLTSTASRSKANRGDLLEYGARSKIIKSGANSPDSLRSDHLPYVICDEVDAFPWDVGGEGDPMTLIENRQRTFSRAKTYYVSTPTIDGQSRIHQLYQRSDRRQYHVPCPHCGEFQPLEWKNFRYKAEPPDDAAVDGEKLDQVVSAWYICRECGAVIEEGHKTDMLSTGKWIAQRPGIKGVRGYHINALYAPIGLGLGWKIVAQKWVNSQGDTAELKAFVNTYLGEVWKEIGDSVEAVSLISRLETYAREDLPLSVVTAGVDIQKDRIEFSLVGWGHGEEGWLLDHVILPGDTAQPEVWVDLGEALLDAGVQFAAIDSGYNASFVYEFVKTRRWCWATKGVTGMQRPLVEDEKRRRQRMRIKRKKGVPVEPVGVDGGKAILYARLKMQTAGPGYIHFPRESAFDDEYFAQLAAEKLVTKIKGTRPFQEWVQTRPRNEALDCLLLALVALRLSGNAENMRAVAKEGLKKEDESLAMQPVTDAEKERGRGGVRPIRELRRQW